jgi:hypothetical protein
VFELRLPSVTPLPAHSSWPHLHVCFLVWTSTVARYIARPHVEFRNLVITSCQPFLGVSFGVNSLDNSVPAGTPVNYEGNLIFGDTGAGYTGLSANFVGVVPTIAPMNIAPSSYDFGGVSQGSTATVNMPFVLTNNDSVPYTISSIQMTGTYAGDFVQTNNCPISPNTLGAGASCTLTVSFTPSTSGSTKETAKIVINDNANNSPQTVFLKGAGQ